LKNLEENLNEYRQDLIADLETHERASLEAPDRLAYLTDIGVQKCEILGHVNMINELSLLKKIYYINFCDFIKEVKFIDEPLYRLIDVIFICSNVSIYLIDL
jgi:hypothetical protein